MVLSSSKSNHSLSNCFFDCSVDDAKYYVLYRSEQNLYNLTCFACNVLLVAYVLSLFILFNHKNHKMFPLFILPFVTSNNLAIYKLKSNTYRYIITYHDSVICYST